MALTAVLIVAGAAPASAASPKRNLQITATNWTRLTGYSKQAWDDLVGSNTNYARLVYTGYGQYLDVPSPKTNLKAAGKDTMTDDGAGTKDKWGECVSFVKAVTNTPNTSSKNGDKGWNPGDAVAKSKALPGMAIATFPNGSYSGHAAIFQEYLHDAKGQIQRDVKGRIAGFKVFDQNWNPKEFGIVGTHTIWAYRNYDTAASNGENYSII